jgi:hypothetical protein
MIKNPVQKRSPKQYRRNGRLLHRQSLQIQPWSLQPERMVAATRPSSTPIITRRNLRTRRFASSGSNMALGRNRSCIIIRKVSRCSSLILRDR